MNISIKRVLAGLSLGGLISLLSGCYVAPGYSYVQGNGYAGDAYYGSGPAVVYDYPYGYYPYGYYGGVWGYYGCCYGGWYGRGRYWHGGGHGGYYRGGGHGGYSGHGGHGGSGSHGH